MDHDHLPAVQASAELQESPPPQWRGDIVQYNDGWCVLAWNVQGDVLDTSFGSDHKWLRGLGQLGSMAAIQTESGNTYTMGDSLVFNERDRTVFETEIPVPSITIGAQAEIPGVGTTSGVVGVAVAYKLMPHDDTYPQISRPSPFKGLAERIAHVHDQLGVKPEPLPDRQGDQIREAFAGMQQTIQALGEEMLKPDAVRGVHSTEYLDSPAQVGFGSYSERLKYTEGCVPAKELSQGIGVVAFRTRRQDGREDVFQLMRTPHAYDPRRGGRQIAGNAGATGDFVLSAKESGKPDADTRFRYLDGADLDGVVVEKGQQLLLAGNDARHRQLQIPGEIVNVVGFRAEV